MTNQKRKSVPLVAPGDSAGSLSPAQERLYIEFMIISVDTHYRIHIIDVGCNSLVEQS